jgi:hypothetical protein
VRTVICSVSAVMLASRKSEMVQDAASGDRVMRPEVASERLGQLSDLRAQLALGQRSQAAGVALPGDQRLHHGPPGLGQHLGRDRGQLDPGVLQDLFQTLDFGGTSVDLGLAIAGQLPQFPDRQRRHEARAHHPMGSDIGQPLGVSHVGHWATLLGMEAVKVFVAGLGDGWGDGQRRSPAEASKTPPRSSLPRTWRPAIEARAQSASQ